MHNQVVAATGTGDAKQRAGTGGRRFHDSGNLKFAEHERLALFGSGDGRVESQSLGRRSQRFFFDIVEVRLVEARQELAKGFGQLLGFINARDAEGSGEASDTR